MQGWIQDFKLGGGGGGDAVKKNCAERRVVNIFGVFRVKNHDFYVNKPYFFPILVGGGGGGVGGGGAPSAPSPLDPPLQWRFYIKNNILLRRFDS